MRIYSEAEHTLWTLGICVAVVGALFILVAWATSIPYKTGEVVVYDGSPVLFLGSAGRYSPTYIVRLQDGTERHVLLSELGHVKEIPWPATAQPDANKENK